MPRSRPATPRTGPGGNVPALGRWDDSAPVGTPLRLPRGHPVPLDPAVRGGGAEAVRQALERTAVPEADLGGPQLTEKELPMKPPTVRKYLHLMGATYRGTHTWCRRGWHPEVPLPHESPQGQRVNMMAAQTRGAAVPPLVGGPPVLEGRGPGSVPATRPATGPRRPARSDSGQRLHPPHGEGPRGPTGPARAEPSLVGRGGSCPCGRTGSRSGPRVRGGPAWEGGSARAGPWRSRRSRPGAAWARCVQV